MKMIKSSSVNLEQPIANAATFRMTFLRWPKRPLDEQEQRRLVFSFERQFSPLKARDRVPPHHEFILRDSPFELSQEQLKNPNRKVKHAEGRTPRTPLMDAAREGSLSDVKRAIAAGGDPNDFIKESGEGPLTYALRRAFDRGDPVIMDYLLQFDLSKDTVNRQASTSRETPLKIAIEMADAATVERLIALGSDVEHACDYVPSALCYAMLLLHGSIHRLFWNSVRQLRARSGIATSAINRCTAYVTWLASASG